MGLRVNKTDSSGVFNYVTDGTDVASPILKDGAATYTPGLSERRGTTSKFLHGDHLGSTRGITDSSQTVTDAILYDGFGMVVTRTGTTLTPFGFVGGSQYQTDADSGLMLLGHRYYDAGTGRFISQDPIHDGTNWYAYCENNPLVKTDPEGLAPPGNYKIDPEQLERLQRELKDLKDKGSLPPDRSRINDIKEIIRRHEKAVGDRHRGGGDHRRPAEPQPIVINPPRRITAPSIDWVVVAGGALIIIGVGAILIGQPEIALPAISLGGKLAHAF